MKNGLKILFISFLLLNSFTLAAVHHEVEGLKGQEPGKGLTPLGTHRTLEEWTRRYEEAKKSAESQESKDAQEAMKRYYEMYPRPGLF